MTALIDWFWNRLLGVPLDFLGNTVGFDVATPWKATAWKVAIVVVTLLLAYETYLRVRKAYRRSVLREHLLTPEEEGALVADSRFRDDIEATSDPGAVIAKLKKERRWADLAAVFSAIKRHKNSAYYYRKAGQLREAANEWAKAGKPLKAAKLLQKSGDHEMAARFYLDKNRYRQAAVAYTQAGDLPNAAKAYGMAGKLDNAVASFKNFFAEGGSGAAQTAAADACYQFLQSENVRKKLDPGTASTLKVLIWPHGSSSKAAIRARQARPSSRPESSRRPRRPSSRRGASRKPPKSAGATTSPRAGGAKPPWPTRARASSGGPANAFPGPRRPSRRRSASRRRASISAQASPGSTSSSSNRP